MLAIETLDVDIGPVHILRGVSLTVPPSSMVGLIGRNGAGKTTLMRAVMGLLAPRTGQIRLNEVDLRRAPAQARARLGIGFMPEDRKLVPDFTVAENIQLPAWATGRSNVEKRLAWIRELMPELDGMFERRANQLSGGQQKMVALARALLAAETLLLLDEPFEGLAPALARRFAEILAELRKSGLSVLVADSDQRHVEDLLSDMYSIERGEVTHN